MEAEIIKETTLTRPTFEMEVEVRLPKDMPQVEHNLDKLKDYALALNDFYSKLVIEEKDKRDAEQEKTKLNKLIDSVKRLRIDNVKEYKKPIEDFEKTAKEVESILGEAVGTINSSLTIFEDKRKQEKLDKVITPLINTALSNAFMKGYLIDKTRILYDDRWFNKTYKDDDIEKDINDQIEEIVREEDNLRQGIEVIKSNIAMANNPTLNEEMYIERFKFSRDLTSVLSDITNDNKRKPCVDSTKETQMTIDDLFSATETTSQVSFRGSAEQIAKIRAYAKEIGMEEI